MRSPLAPIPLSRVARATPDREARAPRPAPLASAPPLITAVCLDIDDTLIDFTGSARAAVRRLIDRDDMWTAWQRVTDEHHARAVAGEYDYDTMRRLRTKAFLADLGALVDDEAVAVLEDRRLAEMRGAWRLFSDTIPCLDWLRAAGLRLGAVTNASGPQRARLADLGLDRFFDAVVSPAATGAAKPDPVIFHAACDQLGAAPASTLHIGDRLDLDAHAARDAGLHGVWLDRTGEHSQAAGVPVLDSLADLPTLLVTDYRTPTLTSGGALPAPR
ncbi:HAD family hydrolase [Actinokineospora sp. G85]|uniref:HAD family hydrolase n=1 Tax=Actinokineospora sp. G85 TaxID=3406626 RepID=UPI003C72CDCF